MTNKQKLPVSRLKELSERSLYKWLLSVLFDWSIIIATFAIACSSNHILVSILAIFIIGNRQHALAIMGHDGTHYTISKNRKLNDIISNLLAFWPLGLTTSGYRNIHFAHHAHTNTSQDPELMHRSMKAPQWDLPITAKKIFYYGLLDMIGFSASDYYMIITFSKPNSTMEYAHMAIYHGAFISICLLSGFYWVPVLWYASLLTSFMMFFRFRTWMEHQGSDETHRLKLNMIERALFAPHQVWHHYEHHMYPAVPYYNLHHIRGALSEQPVMTLKELIDSYETYPHHIKSGQPMKAL